MPDAPATRRPWYKLHASTWVVVALLAVALVLIVVPGQDESYFEWEFPSRRIETELAHGWPWTFLSREVKGPPARIGWLALQGWTVGGDNYQFDGTSLASDCGVALAILVGTACLLEWRRRRRNRFWQFTLKEVGLLATLAAVVGGYEKQQYNSYVREKAIAKSFAEAFDVEWMYAGPLWVKRLAGYEIPYRFAGREAWYFDVELTPARFTQLRGLHRLKTLDLAYAPVSDATLRELSFGNPLDALESLGLEGTDVSDVGLASLSNCRRLQILHLGGTRCRGQFLERLAGAKLEVIGLSGTPFNDAAAPLLALHQYLESLDLSNTRITDEGLAHVAFLPHLKYLNLSNTAVTDSGLAQLTACDGLKLLSLDGTSTGDGALEHLAEIHNLEALELEDTPITVAGLATLLDLDRLKYLDISGTALEDNDLPTLCRFKGLKWLRLPRSITSNGENELRLRLSGCVVKRSMSVQEMNTPDENGFLPNLGFPYSRWPGDIPLE